uniref:Allergen Pet c 1 n=1 Tax=Petroselinum crispum TaxID=4043 RepID=PET1_PETCR|nr:RecName: Full=Allergen Pet c 1; AltName: Allergen=Allergen Pet c 1.0201 [Petroselinum crispum]
GVQKTVVEAPSTVSAEKMYGFLLDMDTVFPKVLPQLIGKSVEILEGDGSVGTVKLVHLGEATEYTTMKQRVDVIDKAGLAYTYTTIGGDILVEVLESVVNEFVVVPTDGGCIVKNTTIYNTKGDAVLPEDKVKEATEKSALAFKAVEAYLLAN